MRRCSGIWTCIGDSLLGAVESERSGSGIDRRDDACKLLKLWATEAALALAKLIAAHSCWLAESGKYRCGCSFLRGAPCSKHHLLVSQPWKEQTKLAPTLGSIYQLGSRKCSCATQSGSRYRIDAAVQQSSYAVGLLSPDFTRSTVDSITTPAAARGSPHPCFHAHQLQTASDGKSDAAL